MQHVTVPPPNCYIYRVTKLTLAPEENPRGNSHAGCSCSQLLHKKDYAACEDCLFPLYYTCKYYPFPILRKILVYTRLQSITVFISDQPRSKEATEQLDDSNLKFCM